MSQWTKLNEQIIACQKCPRLIKHCRKVAKLKRRSFQNDRRFKVLYVTRKPRLKFFLDGSVEFIFTNDECAPRQFFDTFDLRFQHTSICEFQNVHAVFIRRTDHRSKFGQDSVDVHRLRCRIGITFRFRWWRVCEQFPERVTKSTRRIVTRVQPGRICCALVPDLNLSHRPAQSSGAMVAMKRYPVLSLEPTPHARRFQPQFSQVVIFPATIGFVFDLLK